MRVLVLEDETQLRERISAALRAQGFAVDECGEGKEALFMGEEYPIDVAVLDLGLPGMSGLEVLGEWRAGGREFPVLILTARGSPPRQPRLPGRPPRRRDREAHRRDRSGKSPGANSLAPQARVEVHESDDENIVAALIVRDLQRLGPNRSET